MADGYWRRVHRRAARTAAERIGLTTWERVVVNVLLIVVALGALLFLGSADAGRDELIVRLAIAAALVLFFPIFYFRELVRTPALMEREMQTEMAARTAEYVAGIDKIARENKAFKTRLSPEAILMSPRYLKLKFQMEPKIGNLSPKDRIDFGLKELDTLTDEVLKGNYESYYLAVHVGQWLRDNAREHYASSMNFQVIQRKISDRMDTIYDHFTKLIRD